MSFMSLPVAGLLDNDGVGVKGSKRTVRVKVLGQELSVPKKLPGALLLSEQVRACSMRMR